MNIHRCKMNKLHVFGIDEWRGTPVTEFAAQSNVSIHRKGRQERKAQLHESLYLEEIIRQGRRQKGSGVLTVHDVINISPKFITK